MPSESTRPLSSRLYSGLLRLRGSIPAVPLTIILAIVIGTLGGYGAVLFTLLIEGVSRLTVEPCLVLGVDHAAGRVLLCFVPAVGILVVAWLTRCFAPEAEGHGVPEVITAVARRDGVIRPRVALVKILASGLCIGTGGSVGREGPIVQIGSSLGSMAGQFFKLSPRHIKVLVAAGAAAGISATFNAPLAGVIFASEIILGSFAVESLTPIVVASVIADVVQKHVGEHGQNPAFMHLNYQYQGAIGQLPTYVFLGLLCGLSAVLFSRLLYTLEDVVKRRLPTWWLRALVAGGIVGVIGIAYPALPPSVAGSQAESSLPMPALFGVGYEVVDHAVHLESGHLESGHLESGHLESGHLESGHLESGHLESGQLKSGQLKSGQLKSKPAGPDLESPGKATESVVLGSDRVLLSELWWLVPLALLKPFVTSLTLAGGGSGGIFAPSLFIGATTGASFGIICNIVAPQISASPGVYAIVGMGAVVAGTTHGVLSAILIVYELTDNYQIILPIMAAAGLSSVIARFIDRESIYYKKLSRRGETIARGHDMHCLEHIMVRDVMIRSYPTVGYSANAEEIVRVARQHADIETLPVMDDNGRLVGIIRPEDLHRVLDTDLAAHLITAEDIAIPPPVAVPPDANLLEALREFGTRDVETLPVERVYRSERRLVGLLQRSDVMRRYRMELLQNGS